MKAKIASLALEWTAQTPQIIDTLDATNKLLEAGWDKDECPVCQQEITVEELQKQVSDSLDAIKTLKELHAREQAAVGNVGTAEENAKRELKKFRQAASELLETSKSSSLNVIDELQLNFVQLEEMLTSDESTQDQLNEALSELQRLAELGPFFSTMQEGLQQDKSQLHVITTSHNNLVALNEKIASEDEILKRLETAKGIVHDNRITFIENILQPVAEEAHRLYEFIHPDEGTKSGRLELDKKKRGSLLQFAEFAGEKDIEPQGYFSDSHLDTLGFCYWMALAKRECPELRRDTVQKSEAPQGYRLGNQTAPSTEVSI